MPPNTQALCQKSDKHQEKMMGMGLYAEVEAGCVLRVLLLQAELLRAYLWCSVSQPEAHRAGGARQGPVPEVHQLPPAHLSKPHEAGRHQLSAVNILSQSRRKKEKETGN